MNIKTVLAILSFFITLSPLIAGRSKVHLPDICLSIRQLSLKDSDILVQLLEDPEILPEVKSCTAYHIGQLLHMAEQGRAETKEAVSQDRQWALAALKKVYYNYQAEVQNNYKVRESVCFALGGLEYSPQAPEAIALLSEIASSDANPAVTIACVTVLGSISKERAAAARSLIALLEKALERKEIQQQDVTLVNLLVTSLGKLGQAEAFVPLMRVLQSGYPIYVKKATERAILSLEQQQKLKN